MSELPVLLTTGTERVQRDTELKAELWARIIKPLESRVVGRMLDANALASVATIVNTILMQMHCEGKFPADYIEFALKVDDIRGQLTIGISRNFRLYPMTAEEYEELLGVAPIQDDLERVNCKTAGQTGHRQCGWCLEHQKPRFMCGCLALPTV